MHFVRKKNTKTLLVFLSTLHVNVIKRMLRLNPHAPDEALIINSELEKPMPSLHLKKKHTKHFTGIHLVYQPLNKQYVDVLDHKMVLKQIIKSVT